MSHTVNKTTGIITLAVLLETFLCSNFLMAGEPSATTAYNAKSGIYCVDRGRSKFYEKTNPDGSLMIELDAAGPPPNFGMFSVSGPAKKISARRWRYKDVGCQIDITLDTKSWRLLLLDIDAQCLDNKGAHAPDKPPLFPLSSYVRPVTSQLDADGGLAADGGKAPSDDCVAPPGG